MRNFKLTYRLFFLVLVFTTVYSSHAQDQESKLLVRLAKLKIDSAQLEQYKAELKEEIEASIRIEPGVLALNAVADKKNPTEITILEVYLNEEAYQQHLKTPHFLKYKTRTKEMVKSLELVETTPILLGTKHSIKTE